VDEWAALEIENASRLLPPKVFHNRIPILDAPVAYIDHAPRRFNALCDHLEWRFNPCATLKRRPQNPMPLNQTL
jgi:hypothetical protein